MLFQNLLVQLIVGFFGILAGSIVATLAEEELEQYLSLIQKSATWVFMITFLVPLIFIETRIPLVILVLSYSILVLFYKQEKKIYALLTPVLLFITTQQKEAFLMTLSVFFLAIMLMTILLLTPFVKKKELHWSKETIRTLVHGFWIFFVMSSVLYAVEGIFL